MAAISKEDLDEFLEKYYPDQVEPEAPSSGLAAKDYSYYVLKARAKLKEIPANEIPCTGVDMYESISPKTGEKVSISPSDQRKKIAQYCSRCNHEMDCAFTAVLGQEKHGVWGGFELKTLKRTVNALVADNFYENYDEESEQKLIDIIKLIKIESDQNGNKIST